MSNNLYMILMVLTMAGVTYIIRVIPMAFFHKKIKSTFIKSLLYYVPYAVLTAMTFPSVFFVTGNVYSAIIGTCVAFLGAVSKRSLVIVAILSVLSVLLFDLTAFIF
ncbi:MAG: AzlD domain-containing protein [Clostridia bacterium]|nr:AzlD domain-containing protein [Clostridia bacterium]